MNLVDGNNYSTDDGKCQVFKRRKWSENDISYLKENYPTMLTSDMSAVMGRSMDSIIIMAGKMGVNKSVCATKNNNLEVLLDESPQSMYWLGFVFADGNVTDTRLSVTISTDDRDHLVKLTDHIGGNIHDYTSTTTFGKCNTSRVSTMDTKTVKTLLTKYDLKPNKTYNPPSVDTLMNIPLEKRISMWLGFIDGDGSIKVQNRKSSPYNVAIKLHTSWTEVLTMLMNDLSEYFDMERTPSVILDKTGYVRTSISHMDVVLGLKQFSIDNNIPVLSRKWDKIDLELKRSRTKLKKSQIDEVLTLFASGHNVFNISKQFGVSYSLIRRIVKSSDT